MKKVRCAYKYCEERRVHWERPFTKRGPQHISVPDDFVGPGYCSIECAMYDAQLKKMNHGAD